MVSTFPPFCCFVLLLTSIIVDRPLPTSYPSKSKEGAKETRLAIKGESSGNFSILFHFISFYFILFYFILFCFVLFCFVLFCFVLFCFIFVFILFLYLFFSLFYLCILFCDY